MSYVAETDLVFKPDIYLSVKFVPVVEEAASCIYDVNSASDGFGFVVNTKLSLVTSTA